MKTLKVNEKLQNNQGGDMCIFVGVPKLIFLCFSFLSKVLSILMIYKLQKTYIRPLGKNAFSRHVIGRKFGTRCHKATEI